MTERFWAKVVKTDGCWLWAGAVAPSGYGRFGSAYAHRLAWAEEHGAVPSGCDLHHECETPLCVRPSHLVAVTRQEHSRLHRPTACVHGHGFTPENTYVDKHGRWHCRRCRADRMLVYRRDLQLVPIVTDDDTHATEYDRWAR